jgi:hypothetical protein
VLETILAELVASPMDGLPEFARRLAGKLGADAPKDDESPFSAEALARARADAALLLRWRLRRSGGPGT